MFRSRLRPASIRTVSANASPSPRLAALGIGAIRNTVPAVPVRCLQTVPTLDFKDGVPGLLSKKGFDLAYTEYQRMQVDRLNSFISGTGLEDTFPKQLLIMFSRDVDKAPLFNAASMSHNNHFFFSTIAKLPTRSEDSGVPEPSQQVVPIPIRPSFQMVIENNFSSVETFRQYFLDTALAMFGPGFVWLVKTSSGQLKIVCTYLAGSPYSKAHHKKQSVDTNTIPYNHQDAAEIFERSKNPRNHPAGDAADITPILCLNTWEHVWLPDYGMYNPEDPIPSGKERYVYNWWNVVNWDKVADNWDSSLGHVANELYRR
ncbi:37S ribosomal protein S26 mitochondrial [Zalerion maritima]|uniref:37S ribosomal protein S26 mitochondrial n=1 Tax=Zalerion maritima TaxID=339359 RepID=A0AAD5RJE7_9PEZI|nr:37S ribosomal protein S26 mitochondrial [Zalerion maritima]